MTASLSARRSMKLDSRKQALHKAIQESRDGGLRYTMIRTRVEAKRWHLSKI